MQASLLYSAVMGVAPSHGIFALWELRELSIGHPTPPSQRATSGLVRRALRSATNTTAV